MPSFWENLQMQGDEMKMYVSVPGGSGPFPGAVVIHHGAGVDQFTRDMADKLAGDGFAAAAPDLFHRIPPDSPLRSAPPGERLNDSQIEVDVDAAVDFSKATGPYAARGWASSGSAWADGWYG